MSDDYYSELDKYYENYNEDKSWDNEDPVQIAEQLAKLQVQRESELEKQAKRQAIIPQPIKIKQTRLNSIEGWSVLTDISRLDQIELQSYGPRHNPIGHNDVLNKFKTALKKEKYQIISENHFISKDEKTYMYLADVRSKKIEYITTTDYIFTVGIINNINLQKAFRGIFGETKLDSNIQMLTMDSISPKWRNSFHAREALDKKIHTIVKNFGIYRRERASQISKYKVHKIIEKHLGLFIVEMLRNNNKKRLFPARDAERIVKLWDKEYAQIGTLWALEQCAAKCSESVHSPTRRVLLTHAIRLACNKLFTHQLK